MGNILNHNKHNLKLILNSDEYWDFFLNKDSFSRYNFNHDSMYDECLITYIDTSNKLCIEGDWLMSTDYTWISGISSGYTLYNVGYTGVDNGLIQFRKDRISNKDFIKIFSESDFSFDKDDLRLKLHAVSGNTMQYEYPFRFENGNARLNGGFFQGVFKTECDKYQILPSSLVEETWDMEFVLNKTEFEKESEKTLNDKHPNNKGIFFYLGTRAENKWIYLYDKQYVNKTSGFDDFMDEKDMECDPDSISRFSDVDWYDDLEEWRINMDRDFFESYAPYYIDMHYYPQDLYFDPNEYFADYIQMDIKKVIIDDKTLGKSLEDCCKDKYYCGSNKKEEFIVTTKRRCCGCGQCTTFTALTPINVVETKCCSERYLFDEYLEDADEVFNWYGDSDYVEPELDISMFDFQTMKYGLSINSRRRYKTIFSDNKFLLFHRCGDGFTISNWVEETVVEYRQLQRNFKGNLFLLMNRTCTGYTVATIDELRDEYISQYNIYEDLYNNALAFRITDNGEIGYRYLSVDCEISGDNKIKIYEGYSNPNVISENEWHVIHVKIIGGVNTMSFRFYVDGKLKYITQEMPILNLRKLIEEDEKQELVPFNLSLGGGTQGLSDVILPNYLKIYDYVFPLEENFAGSFIGYIKIFKWFNCSVEYMNILNNFKYEMGNLKQQ